MFIFILLSCSEAALQQRCVWILLYISFYQALNYNSRD